MKYSKLHYQNNKASYFARNKRYRDNLREMVSLLKNAPCVDCGGLFHPCAMDFDHVRGTKEFEIGKRNSISKETLLAEISKCELVCANCHRVRTYKRRQK